MRTWTDRGKKAPIAWVIATEPAVHLATVANLPYGKDEMEFAGGLKGEPIEVVRCKTIDLQVPANSEIVIEGEVMPGEMEYEGPFGEFAGVMGPVEKRFTKTEAMIAMRDGVKLHTTLFTPKDIQGLPSLVAKPGMMVWKGRLPGA